MAYSGAVTGGAKTAATGGPIARLANVTADLLSASGSRNRWGEWEGEHAPPVPVRLYTEPVSDRDSGRERLILAEGQRIEDLRRFWIPGDVPVKLSPPDRLVLGADAYDLIKVDRYEHPRLGHTHALGILRHGEPPAGELAGYTPTRAAQERRIRGWVALGTALEPPAVIPAFDGGPRPVLPFGVLRLVEWRYESEAETQYADHDAPLADTLDRTDAQAVVAMYAVELYGRDAMDRAARLRLAIGSGDQWLRPSGIGMVEVGDGERADDIVGGAFEGRSTVLLTLSWAVSLVRAVEAADRFGLTLVTDADGVSRETVIGPVEGDE